MQYWSVPKSDGSVWYVNTNGELFFYAVDGGTRIPDTNWHQNQMGIAEVIAVSTQANIWCINQKGEVWNTIKATPGMGKYSSPDAGSGQSW